MVTEADIIKDVRLELGDLIEPFRDSFRGNGEKREWSLPAHNIIPASVTAKHTTFPAPGSSDPVETNEYTSGDYTLNAKAGMIKFDIAPPLDSLVVVEGEAYGIFSEDQVAHFVKAALDQHLGNRTVDRRYYDGRHHIRYDREPMTVETLPDKERILVTILATIEALWALSTDASLDVDIQTAEGTSIPRGQRHRQIITQIDLLTDKYKELSLAMGVGLFAPEVNNIRRVSRTTNRLVPIFRPREYDEHGPPVRKSIPLNTKGDDPDGPPSPIYPSWGY